MISSLVERYLMPRTFRISLTYAIFIIFGLALGPWRGAFLGLLSDTLNQVIFGISTWMIEYAIIPVIISFLSGLLINIICRWLWGPFAYINYHNRFRNGTWKYKDYYLIFMIPIIFKSLIEVPIYTIIIYSFFPVINILRRKIYFYRTQTNS